MNYQPLSFASEGNWNENLWNGLKVEIPLKIQMNFLSFVNLHVVQRSKQVKLSLWIK